MYVCMYVWMYVCMYVCMYECMYVCMHAWMYVYAFVYIYIYACVCVCMHVYIYIYEEKRQQHIDVYDPFTYSCIHTDSNILYASAWLLSVVLVSRDSSRGTQTSDGNRMMEKSVRNQPIFHSKTGKFPLDFSGIWAMFGQDWMTH